MADHHPRSPTTDENDLRYLRRSHLSATATAANATPAPAITTTVKPSSVAAAARPSSLASASSPPPPLHHHHRHPSSRHSNSRHSHSHSQLRYSGSSQFSGSASSDIYGAPSYHHSARSSSNSSPFHHYAYDYDDDDPDYEHHHYLNSNDEHDHEHQHLAAQRCQPPPLHHHHRHTTSAVILDDDNDDDDDINSNYSSNESTSILPSKAYVPPPRASLPSRLKAREEESNWEPSSFSHEVKLSDRPASVNNISPSGSSILLDPQQDEKGEEQVQEEQKGQVSDHHSTPSALAIPKATAGSASSWLLDASASPTTIVPRDLDRFPRGTSPNLNPLPAVEPCLQGQQQHEPDNDQSSTLYSYRKTSYPEDSFLNVSQQDHSRPRTEQSFASFHTAQNSIDNSSFDPDEDEGVVGDVEPSPSNARAASAASVSSTSKEATPIVTDASRLTMSPKLTPHPNAQNLTLKIDGSLDPALLNDINDLSTLESKQPKSPVGKISSFFGWKSSPRAIDSPTTPFSENRSMSFEHSPAGPSTMDPSRRPSAAELRSPYSSGTSYSIPGDHVDELIQELREVSTELAASIRREMELEDELDRFKTDMPTGPNTEHTRRTSDYYSDSGASSVARMMPEAATPNNLLTETKIEGLEKMRRKAEQEKAQLRLDMTEKMQEDLNQRRALEMHVQSLEERLQSQGAVGDRRDLEVSLEDTKRRLNEERQFKQNFEDLLGGMREELEGLRNERDNLRDEVVPQLKSRLEGVEADALEKHNLTYENARMQQEMQSLKNENQTLVNARRMAIDMQGARQRSGSTSASGVGGGGGKSSPGAPAGEDSFKDVEDQRDALHKTLKSLVIRQDHLTKNHAKHMRVLEAERDRALATTPQYRRGSSNPEVQRLRREANELRIRADDAMEEKWQCEKGLSGLKMDLDRAKQETASLRELLKEEDIFTNSRPSTPSGSVRGSPDRSTVAVADSLDKLYAELRMTGATSPAAANLVPQVEQQLEVNQQLRKKLAVAIERGVREQASAEDRINEMQSALRKAEEDVLASQQVTEDTISQQEGHVRDIREIKSEKELRGVRSGGATKRVPAIYSGRPGDLKTSQRTSMSAGKGPRDTLFALRSPKLDETSSGAGISITQASNMAALEKNIKELEREAHRADKEMQSVIERMNRAQLEVAELQAERDESTKETRRLQREIIAARQGGAKPSR